MAALAHDKDGFLVGERIGIDDRSFGQALDIWREIKADTAAIRSSVEKGIAEAARRTDSAAQAATQSAKDGVSRQAVPVQLVRAIESAMASANDSSASRARAVRAELPARGSDGRFVSAVGKAGEKEKPGESGRQSVIRGGDTTPDPVAVVAEGIKAAGGDSGVSGEAVKPANLIKPMAASIPVAARAATPERGKNGRFIPGSGPQDGKRPRDESSSGVLSRAADSIGDAAEKIASAAAQTEQLDPTIAAAKEMGDLVSPVISSAVSVSKGVAGLFGKSEEKDEQM